MAPIYDTLPTVFSPHARLFQARKKKKKKKKKRNLNCCSLVDLFPHFSSCCCRFSHFACIVFMSFFAPYFYTFLSCHHAHISLSPALALQVEYALKAIDHAGAVVGILTKHGIVLGAERKVPNLFISFPIITPFFFNPTFSGFNRYLANWTFFDNSTSL